MNLNLFDDIDGLILRERENNLGSPKMNNRVTSGSDALTFPEGHGGVHQPDESLEIEGFFTALRAIAHTVLQCDELLQN